MFGTNPVIEKATVDNDVPTPGYMYSEVSKLTFQGVKECERVRTQLLGKLKGTSPAVKIKVLMILKHLLDNGHPSFQTLLQAKADEIRPCLDFKAPPDPLHGDAPSRLVREKASQVMNALYETRTDASYEYNAPAAGSGGGTVTVPGTPNPNAPILSGSQSTSSSIILGKGGPTSIEGPKLPSKKETSVFESLKQAALKFSPPNSTPTKPQGTFKPLGGPVNYPINNRNFGLLHMSQSAENAFVDVPRDAGRPGGGWDTCEDNNSALVTGEEADLVSQFCNLNSKGNNYIPSRPQIADAFAKATTKDISMLSYCLALQLNNPNWRNRVRALHLIHELLLSETTKAETTEYFSAEPNYAALAWVNSSVQTTLRDKLSQVLELLPAPAAAAAAVAILPPPPTANLATQEPFSNDTAVEDLFGGLDVGISNGHTPSSTDNNPTPSLFGGLTSSSHSIVASSSSSSVASHPAEAPSPLLLDPFSNDLESSTGISPAVAPSPAISSSATIPATTQSFLSQSSPTPQPTLLTQPNSLTSPPAPTTSTIPATTATTATTTATLSSSNQNEKLLSEIFNQTNQNRHATNHINSLLNNTPSYPYPVAMPMMPGMSGYPYPVNYSYPYYPGYPPTMIPQVGQHPGTVGAPSFGVPSQYPVPSGPSATGGFDFVSKETVEKKDPFDFIKVGQ